MQVGFVLFLCFAHYPFNFTIFSVFMFLNPDVCDLIYVIVLVSSMSAGVPRKLEKTDKLPKGDDLSYLVVLVSYLFQIHSCLLVLCTNTQSQLPPLFLKGT